MKIKSGFKDYYDWVADKYGGGDPRVTYVRDLAVDPERLKAGGYGDLYYNEYDDTLRLNWSKHQEHFVHVPREVRRTIDGYVYEQVRCLLIVAGEPMYIERLRGCTPGWPISPLAHERHMAEHETGWTIVPSDGWERINAREYGDGAYARLARYLRCGAFIVFQSGSDLCIVGNTPKLADYGVAGVWSAETTYQKIALFLGSLVAEAPATKLSDVQKVEAHGFDKRQSFRHRKNDAQT